MKHYIGLDEHYGVKQWTSLKAWAMQEARRRGQKKVDRRACSPLLNDAPHLGQWKRNSIGRCTRARAGPADGLSEIRCRAERQSREETTDGEYRLYDLNRAPRGIRPHFRLVRRHRPAVRR